MEAIKIFDDKKAALTWNYDGEADVLYLSLGDPKPATGLDMGDGVILRYDEKARELVGLTITGVGRRLEEYLSHSFGQ